MAAASSTVGVNPADEAHKFPSTPWIEHCFTYNGNPHPCSSAIDGRAYTSTVEVKKDKFLIQGTNNC